MRAREREREEKRERERGECQIFPPFLFLRQPSLTCSSFAKFLAFFFQPKTNECSTRPSRRRPGRRTAPGCSPGMFASFWARMRGVEREAELLVATGEKLSFLFMRRPRRLVGPRQHFSQPPIRFASPDIHPHHRPSHRPRPCRPLWKTSLPNSSSRSL